VAGLSPLWPTIRIVIADAGHKSRKLAAEIKRREGWKLLIVKRSDGAWRWCITGHGRVGAAAELAEEMPFGYRGGPPAQEPSCRTKPTIPVATKSRRLATGSTTGRHTMRRCGIAEI
jgi:hypothetical protein